MPLNESRPVLPRTRAARRRVGIATGVAAVTAGGAVMAVAAPTAAHPATSAGAAPRAHAASEPPHLRRARGAHQAPPVEPATLLELGSKGRAVSELQGALHMHPNGRFDGATKRAVFTFQRRHNLLVDGIVGPQTWDTLFHIRPKPVPAVTASSSATNASYSSGSNGYSIPASIVQCESGGNYSAVNPSSGAGGAYQIMPSTWQAYGGQGLPQNASPAEQNRIAARIYATQGRSAWSC